MGGKALEHGGFLGRIAHQVEWLRVRYARPKVSLMPKLAANNRRWSCLFEWTHSHMKDCYKFASESVSSVTEWR